MPSTSLPGRRAPVINRIVLFGVSGDLAARFLLPALASLHAAGRLPDGFRIIGAARESWDVQAFREHAVRALDRHAGDVPAGSREAVARALDYRQVDLADQDSVTHAVQGSGAEPLAAYLALPPGLFAGTATRLAAAGLPQGSRIAVEKPFGEDLQGAISLNELLARLFGEEAGQMVFRVDHVLGMATAQNLLGLRLNDRILGSVWNGTHIAEVQVLWEEDLALEGRAAYYDGAGALKDVMQNHMLQVLCLLAMEPGGAGDPSLHDRKTAVLRSLRPPSGDPASWTRRARYTAGNLGDRAIAAYAEEDGVDPDRGTETFAELALELDSERWTGTRFLLRAGKAIGRQSKEAVIKFRAPDRLGPETAEAGGPRNELRIGIEGPEDIALRLVGSQAGTTPRPAAMSLRGPPPPSDLPAYGRVLDDILCGGSALSVGGDTAEEAWRVVSPVLQAWADGVVPLEEYPAGSGGPPPRG